MFSNRFRKVGSKALGESNVFIFDLPRKDLVRNYMLYMVGNLVIGTLGSPVNRALFPFNFITRVELIGDGRDTIKSIPGWALAMKNHFNYGIFGYRYNDTYAADATNAFRGLLTLNMVPPGTLKDSDFFFDTGRYSTLELRITTGTFAADLFSTAPTAITSGTVSMDVYAEEVVNLNNTPLALFQYKENYLEQLATATNSAQQFLLPVGNVYKGLMIETATSKEGAAGILNNATLQSGTTVFGKADAIPLQYTTAQHRGFRTLSELTGFYYLDLSPEGRLIDCLNTMKMSQLELILDITGVANSVVRVYPDEYIAPRRA